MRLQNPPAIRRLAAAVVLAVAVSVAAAACARRSADAARTEVPPSIILIVVDTLRADYLGCYGFDGGSSPVLDTLADESVLFEACSAQAPWTTPSMAAAMTSLYPEAHGVRLQPDDPRDQQSWRERWTRAIPDSTSTLAECLRDRGYRTAGLIANPFLARGLGFEQGFDTFDESAALSGERDSTALLESGVRWFRSKEASGGPTFLYLHLMDVHGPYTAPDADFEAVREAPGLGPPVTLDGAGFGRIQPYLRSPPWSKGRDRRELRLWRGRYAAGVHAADRHLGLFISELEKAGLWDDQLVVVTSDHGEELYDHGNWDHGFSLHRHQLHVPLMIRFPHGRFGGSRIGGVVRLVDLMPTLIGLAGAAPPPGVTGSDLLPLVAEPDWVDQRRIAFGTSVKEQPGARSVFDGRFKLIADLAGGRPTLYDLDADPEERVDIAADEPEKVGQLADLLRDELALVSPGEGSPDVPGDLSSEQLERLRELGYLQ